MKNVIKLFFFSVMLLAFTGCGIRSIPMQKNAVEAAWAEVENQYKRRTDLVPNLVNTVKGYAKHERETLQAVIDARAKATQTQISADQLTPEALANFQKAQGALSSALSRLMVVVERYPDLKASANFRDLQTQLEGTENRITIARRRFIEDVKKFNNFVTVIPHSWTNSLFFKFEKMPQFAIEESEKATPKVEF